VRQSSEFWVAQHAKTGCAGLLLIGVAFEGGTVSASTSVVTSYAS
jgi:hypothetical protein